MYMGDPCTEIEKHASNSFISLTLHSKKKESAWMLAEHAWLNNFLVPYAVCRNGDGTVVSGPRRQPRCSRGKGGLSKSYLAKAQASTLHM